MTRQDNEFAKGWPYVLCALLGVGIGLGPVPFYTIGMVAPHLAKTFGWSFSEIMLGLPVMTFAALLAGPVIGILADKFGVRRVALISVVIFSLSYMAFGLSNGSLPLYLLTWTVMAIGGAGTLPMTWTRPISAHFRRQRGLALGFALMGTGLFGFLIKPFAAWLIAEHGWRSTYFVIGALPLLITLPVALKFFHDIKPDATSQPEASKAAADGLTLKEALKTWRFWAIWLAFVPIAFATSGPIPNMENLLKAQGFDLAQIVSLAPLIGLSVIVGRLLGGWLIDHFWAPGVAMALLSVSALGCVALAQPGAGYGHAFFAICMIGFAAGMEYDLLAYLTARYFGLRGYASIYGALYGAYALGAGVAPVAYGAVFDKTGGYGAALWLSAVLLVLGALVLLTLGRYRREAEPETSVTEDVARSANHAPAS
ncbi:MFS transporter [Caulobacter sp. BP25]|uniref:MFS transporter n=1 Tax=Caulobacter sp. BP25 TaxID=2048900 RepID=UPI000C12DE1B|nr:MFS transporter [Caulobacter sp. BP25]PHY19716.1 MFS transporter [Caulobacter sp. BP25]